MTGIDAMKAALQSTQHLVNWFVGDLSDADLLVRPTPGANHIAWQMGHLIVGERGLLLSQFPEATLPELPPGFAERYTKETASSDTGFHSKAELVEWFNKMRQGTLAVVASLSDADLDRPTVGSMAQFAPTLGAFLILMSNHALMHGGQFSVTRRKLSKPVLF